MWPGRLQNRPRFPQKPSIGSATDTIDRVLHCLSGSVAVSAYELGALHLPCEETLAQWSLLEGERFNEAFAAVYRAVVK